MEITVTQHHPEQYKTYVTKAAEKLTGALTLHLAQVVATLLAPGKQVVTACSTMKETFADTSVPGATILRGVIASLFTCEKIRGYRPGHWPAKFVCTCRRSDDQRENATGSNHVLVGHLS